MFKQIKNIFGVIKFAVKNSFNPYQGWTQKFDGRKTAGIKDYPSLRGFNVEKLQERAIEVFWDSIHGKSIIKRLVNLTVNTGLKLEIQPRAEYS